jgi:hypothetical protein
MVTALVLQLCALVGLPIGGFVVADVGGLILGASASVLYVGLAIERAVT